MAIATKRKKREARLPVFKPPAADVDVGEIDFGKLNRSQIARDTGISLSMISRLCNDDPTQTRAPRKETLRKFAEWLGVDPGELSKARGWI